MKHNQSKFVIISPFTESDIGDILSIESECQLSTLGESGYLKLLSDPKSVTLVATSIETNIVCGFFSAYVVIDELQIDNIAISTNYRNQGIASLLLNHALKLAVSKGAHTAILEVRANNFPARRLYEQHGFSITGLRKNYYNNPPDDALILALTLDQPS